MRKFKLQISILILLFINFIFSYKYISRYVDSGIYFSLFLFFFQLCVYLIQDRVKISFKQKSFFAYGFIGVILILVIIIHYTVDLSTLQVDRWSVISSFFTEFYNGDYPYFAKSHMGNFPGPMPVYFIISWPFYMLGELSILSCLGYCLYVFLVIKKYKSSNNLVFILIYLSTSLFLLWEIITRSNLFTFTIFVLFVLNEYSYYYKFKKNKFYIMAIITGLLLSTRSVYILPYLIFFLSSLINKEISLKKLLVYISIMFIAFVSSFLPLVYFFKDDFFKMNPFIIQSSFFLPTIFSFIFIFIAFFLAFLVKSKSDKFFFSGISLFVTILIYSIYIVITNGFYDSLFGSSIDISYFIFCIPFLMTYLIIDEEMDKNTSIKAT